MNEFLTAIINIIYLMFAIALLDRVIELFKNIKK